MECTLVIIFVVSGLIALVVLLCLGRLLNLKKLSLKTGAFGLEAEYHEKNDVNKRN